MSTPDMSPPVAASLPTKSFAGRFAGVFFSPGETFADIVRAPNFIAPLVALVVATVAVTETMLAEIGMERIVRASIEQSKNASSMSPEQVQRAVEQGARIGGIIAHLSGFLALPIFLLVIAGIGLLIVNAIFGAQADFKTAFAICCHANLVSMVGVVMTLAMILGGDAEHFNAQNMMPSNPGFFLNPVENSKPVLALASSLDIFSLWLMALLGIGFSAATRAKVKPLPIFLTYLGLWMIYVVGKVGLAMLT